MFSYNANLFYDTETETAAWHDPSDSKLQIDLTSSNRLRKLRRGNETTVTGEVFQQRLREVFHAIHSERNWATKSETDEIFATDRPLLNGPISQLPSGTIDLVPLKDANMSDPCQSIVSCLEFHPSAPSLLAVGGLDGFLRLFNVDGTHNTKVSGMHFNSLPIRNAKFINSGTEIFLTGRRKFAYSVNVETSQITRLPFIKSGIDIKSLEHCSSTSNSEYICFGATDGLIVVCSAKSKNFLFCLKMNGPLSSLFLSESDSDTLFSTGRFGEVYIWSLRQRECVLRFTDYGTVKGSCIAGDKDYLVSGNDTGCVNVYSMQKLLKSADECNAGKSSLLSRLTKSTQLQSTQPLKTILNLTTHIDALTINHSSELLVMSSFHKKDALKLIHLPTQTVFSNFPTAQTPLHYVECHAFSPHSGFLTIGNDRGRVLLYRVNHFQQS